MKSIFSEKQEKKCETCIFSAFNADADKLLCEKKGLVDRHSKCFRYRYDPFKRVPKKDPSLPKMEEKDFSLDVSED